MGEKKLCWPGFFAAQLCINYLMHWSAMLFFILLSPVKVSLGETCVNRAVAAGVYKALAHSLGSITYCCLQGQDRCNVILHRAPFSTSTSTLPANEIQACVIFLFLLERKHASPACWLKSNLKTNFIETQLHLPHIIDS